jgi:hypothetical protein
MFLFKNTSNNIFFIFLIIIFKIDTLKWYKKVKKILFQNKKNKFIFFKKQIEQ